ncbi:prolipoprotein diacylglyceryl transferase [Cytophagaceae bacterium ABcell3]|nr:prolipoprotein diacylglyceryl transferase [Cytophagaceae bacterium ABcell3]
MKFLEKVKNRWGITSNWQVFVIFFVFGVTGSLSLKVGKPILDFMHITDDMNAWLYWPLRLLIVFPIYQVLLLAIGGVCGQFTFFWNIIKKTFGRMIPKANKKAV